MSVFADKKFENLDWISVATEPIESNLNQILSLMPDDISIDYKRYMAMVGSSWNIELDLRQIVHNIMYNSVTSELDEIINTLSWEQKQAVVDCFSMEIVGEPIIDFLKEEIYGGEIIVQKNKSTMDEQILKGMLGKQGIEAVQYMGIPANGITRANEIMELLGGCEEGLKGRSTDRKRRFLARRLTQIFKNNEWNIKDTGLADKVGQWICAYVKHGDLSALSNFCRLKVMTHKGNPIYSMEEVV